MEWKRWVPALGFGLWLIAATFAAASLTAWHSIALPDSQLPKRAAREPDGRWHMTHYFSAACACSWQVARYLAGRKPLAGVQEDIVVIASDDPSAGARMLDLLKRNAFRTRIMTPEVAAAEDGVEGVPMLQIQSPDGAIKFRGGYREHGHNQFLDVSIISGLMKSSPVVRPGIYGCATTHRLRSLLDPLSLKVLSRQ